MSTSPHILYGWEVSPYTAKTRTHLVASDVPYREVYPTVFTLAGRIRRNVGRSIMPTVYAPDGHWLQDSSELFDYFESIQRCPSFVPNTPKQRVLCYLLECFSDEWLPMSALHYRWNTPENRVFARLEFAKHGMPYWPAWIRNRVARSLSQRLIGYLNPLGVTESTIPALEETTAIVIQAVEDTLSEHPYLLGARPSLADFSLFGPLWAHLYRDPGSRHLFDDAPNTVAWFQRLQTKTDVNSPPYLPDDVIPTTLHPLLEILFEDQWSWIQTLVDAINAYCIEHPEAPRVPRALGSAWFTIRGQREQRKLITFVQWKAQRARLAYTSTSPKEQEAIREWLTPLGGQTFIECPIQHPFVRRDYKCIRAPSA